MSNDVVSPEHKLTVIIVNRFISRFDDAMDINLDDIVDISNDKRVRLIGNSLASYVKNFDAVFDKEWEEELGSFMKELMHEYIYRIADHLRYEAETTVEDLEEARSE